MEMSGLGGASYRIMQGTLERTIGKHSGHTFRSPSHGLALGGIHFSMASKIVGLRRAPEHSPFSTSALQLHAGSFAQCFCFNRHSVLLRCAEISHGFDPGIRKGHQLIGCSINPHSHSAFLVLRARKDLVPMLFRLSAIAIHADYWVG